MIQAIACPYLLFVWPHKGTNPGWSFIGGQSLCLQWHHKCPCRENNGWWIQQEPGTVDSRDPTRNLSCHGKFLRQGPTPWPNTPQKKKKKLSEQGSDGESQSRWWRAGGWDGWDHQVMTLNVYMKLCVCWRQSGTGLCSLGKKDALFL